MDEPRVKGEVFQTVFRLVAGKWGQEVLDGIRADPDSYAPGEWYHYSAFCDILTAVKDAVGRSNPMIIYQLGFSTMKKDARWSELFQTMNPADVFRSTERQDTQYRVGHYSAEAKGNKHIQVKMTLPDCRPEWCEFYRGRLQGVLELTGRTGVVHLQRETGSGGERIFDIKWG